MKLQIERQKIKYGWEFIFLGANIDAVQTAGRFGISADRAVDYLADSGGTRVSYMAMSAAVSEYRELGSVQDKTLNMVRKDTKNRKH